MLSANDSGREVCLVQIGSRRSLRTSRFVPSTPRGTHILVATSTQVCNKDDPYACCKTRAKLAFASSIHPLSARSALNTQRAKLAEPKRKSETPREAEHEAREARFMHHECARSAHISARSALLSARSARRTARRRRMSARSARIRRRSGRMSARSA